MSLLRTVERCLPTTNPKKYEVVKSTLRTVELGTFVKVVEAHIGLQQGEVDKVHILSPVTRILKCLPVVSWFWIFRDAHPGLFHWWHHGWQLYEVLLHQYLYSTRLLPLGV